MRSDVFDSFAEHLSTHDIDSINRIIRSCLALLLNEGS